MARILIVEDEAALNDLIARLLRQEGHEVIQAVDGKQGLAAVETSNPDLVILDWMLPKIDGLGVCAGIREKHITPIIMLTARGDETDLILGLEAGADEFVTKPFKNRELIARVRAHLRRQGLHREYSATQAASHDELPLVDDLRVGPLGVNIDQRAAFLHDDEIDLTPKEFDLLALFVQNPGRAFSRDYLLERVWGDDVYVTDRTVDTHVQRLRKKLGEEAEMIRTVWGVGYKLQRES
jgi:two-component system phosphate regulon response regulator PhoB